MYPKDADGLANSVDPVQEQSDLDLHCLSKPNCPKTLDHYSINGLKNASRANHCKTDESEPQILI